jgi:hypothetical protein
MKIHNEFGLRYHFDSFYEAMAMMQNIFLQDGYGGNLSVTSAIALSLYKAALPKKHIQ